MDHNYQNLVFKGGGVKGVAYAGALEALHERTCLGKLKRVAGTSAGAITAALLAVGYTPKEITDIVVNDMDFESFMDSSWLAKNIWRFFKHYGWYKGDAFSGWLMEKMKQKTGSGQLNFMELNELHGVQLNNYKQLFVVVTDLSRQTPVIFSHQHNNYTPIAKAVRMSMSIPLFFKSIKWNGSVMVDGGMAYNYPIDLFDAPPYHTTTQASDPINKETLGLWLDTKAGIDNLRRHMPQPPKEIQGIRSYSTSLVAYLMEMANQAHLEPHDWNRSVLIDTLDIQATDFSKVKTRMPELVQSGKEGVRNYFEWLDKSIKTS